MRAKDIMTSEIKVINQESTVREAAQLMSDYGIGVLPVSDDGNVTGIVTDRDIVVRSMSKGKNPHKTKIKEVMSERVVTCYQDQNIEKVAELMEEAGIRRMPIVDGEANLVGIISVGDFSTRCSQERASQVLGKISYKD